MFSVQGLEYDAPMELRQWQCVRVQPKRCSSFLSLPGLWPVPKHLKRVKKEVVGEETRVMVLAAPAGEDVTALIAESGFEEQASELVQVPWRGLVRREQLEEFSALWPCQYMEVLPDTEPVTEAFEEACKEWMRLVRARGKGIGCAIVNWETRECVAMAHEDGDVEAGFDGHAVLRAIALVGERNRNGGSGQLFCSGYVVFVTHEPCVMCSMALLHARVRSVVFGSRCKSGGLAGAIRIGSHPSMNHKFNVYGGCLAEGDCNCLI